ncbi:uncharacterized protein N0V89_012124 [Didymosphaeria variabile]|uniref:Uncharacterized protein n=1 Tax=Didymosphaeria variabile TaxID=1932322 RepID=A0A9W9C4P2_9PLEO|nr:uncharacterized protein N0V89_012124 [Didymosphaeria variabile]KAJ4344384.1 hypothetical protein N0V89_012124 [Didymosphaeria variabile]
MAHSVFRKGGVPALAFPASEDASSSCLCTLIVKVNEPTRQATIKLQVGVPVQGFDTEQRITLVYDADNFKPGTTTVSNATVSPSQTEQIARSRGGIKLWSLGLVLKHPCVVLYPPSSGNIAPKYASDTRFQQLMVLAKATRLNIVFDSAWLHPDKAAQFRCLTDKLELTGFPRNYTKIVREADWTIFSPVEAAPPESPPSYDEVSLKRPRQSRTSSLQAPTPKRILLDDGTEFDPGTPTEKATTEAASNPRLLPSSPPTGPVYVQDAVENAVAKLLPDALQSILPGMLTRMFAVPTSSPPPQTTPAALDPMSPLRRIIRNHLTTHADELAKQITMDTHGHALDLRDTADIELQEHIDDHRLEFEVLKEDGLMEIRRLYDTKLEELEERTAELVETVELETSEAYTTAKENLAEFVGRQRMELLKEMLRVERWPRSVAEPAKRARSVPLEVRW